MLYKIRYAYTSHTGKIRANNEDNFWCCGKSMPPDNQGIPGIESGKESAHSNPVLAVFDGMGGESCGEMAAYQSAQTCNSWYQKEGRSLGRHPEAGLKSLCREMNAAVCGYAEENRIHSMGSTVALMTFTLHGIYACNLGDSRIYELREGKLRQLSTDHVVRANLFGKAPLTQFLGIPEDMMILEPGICKCEAANGNRYLICSDGVTDMLSDRELEQLLSQPENVETISEHILARALEQGGRDNITFVLCEIAQREHFYHASGEKVRENFLSGLHKWREKARKE
jgi:protein phosphatase